MMDEEVLILDLFLFRLINGHTGHPAWDRLFLFLTAIGWGGAIWVAFALVLLLGARRLPGLKEARWRAVGLGLLLALCLAWGTETTLKPLIARPRPPLATADTRLRGTLPQSYSLPSGHALTSFAAAGVLTAASRRGNRADAAAPLALAALIGISRIWVGHHYPLDVAAGALLGWLIGRMVWNSLERLLSRGSRTLD